MSSVEDLLKEIQELKNKDNPVQKEVKEVVVKEKTKLPILNIVLVLVICVMGYFLFVKQNNNPDPNPDPISVVDVAKDVEKYENLYSAYKGEVYKKLSDLVLQENGGINNEEQLKVNAQALLEKARESSLGKLDEMDVKFFADKEKFQDHRKEISEYFNKKSEGFIKASK